MAPLDLHHLVLSLEEVPHQLGVPWALGAAAQSSLPLLQLLYRSGSATPPEGPHTTPRFPRPGSASTCPRALPVVPPPIDDKNPRTHPRPPSEEHVMTLHQGHQINVSNLLSHHHPTLHQPRPATISPLPVAPPMVVSWALDEPML
jgi:hypothetical protein